LDDEVAFISSVNADKTLALYSFGAWNGDTPATYTGGYTQAMKWGATTAGTPGGTIFYYFNPASNWTSVEKQWLSTGLALWSAVANISFAQTMNSALALITFTRGSDGHADTTPKYTIGKNAGLTGGTVLLKMTGATVSIDTSVAGFGPIDGSFSNYGGYPLLTLLHEEGHSIGLGHAGPYNDSVNDSTQQFSAYDSMQWSIMSYIDPTDTTAEYHSQYTVQNTYWGSQNVPTTWMPLDILAAERLYGLPTSTPLSGGQTFGFHCNVTGAIEPFFDFTKNTTPVITIWDMGKNNTLDLSGFSATSTVNLNPGTFSSCDGLINNIAIAFNTAVDTLRCGTGYTYVTCNNDGDTVYGGTGRDTINGGTGNDDFSGTGPISVSGGGGDDRATIDDSSAVGPVDVETLSGIGGVSVWDIEHLFLTTGSGDDSVAFTDPTYDTLWGGNSWDGGAGNDTAVVYSSDDTADIKAGFSGSQYLVQRYIGGHWVTALTLTNVEIFNITGSSGNDVLTGGNGNDNFDGGTGKNTISGGGGNDTITDSGAGSTIDGGTGNNRLTLDRSVSTSAITLTWGPASSTATTLSDGTTFKNVELVNLTTGSGNDTVTFNGLGQTGSHYWEAGGGFNTAVVNMSGTTNPITVSGPNISENGANLLITNSVACLKFTGGSGNDDIEPPALQPSSVFDGGAGDDKLTIYAGEGSGPNSLTFTPGSSNWVTLPDGSSLRNIEHLDLTTEVSGLNITFNNPKYDATWGGDTWNDNVAQNDTATVIMSSDTAGMRTIASFGYYKVQQLIKGSWVDTLDLYTISNYNITGGSGNDTLDGSFGNCMLNGGSGSDTASYQNSFGGVTVNLGVTTAQAVGFYNGSDTLVSIENLTGSGYDDVLTGNTGSNVISGGSGNDIINSGGGGTDTLLGGAGNDTFNFTGDLLSTDKIDGGSGTDTVNLDGNYASGKTFAAATMVNVEKLVLAAGYSYKLTTNDATVASGKTLTIDGSALGASDVLTFNGAAETNGKFVIIGGMGADKLTGGAGSDTFTYMSASRSTSTHYDTITGFNFSSDIFDTPGAAGTITAIDTKVTSGSLSTASFDTDLASAMSGHLGSHHAILFKPNAGTLSGQTFLVVDLNGVAGYQSGHDLVIRLIGSSGTLAAGGFH